MSINPYAHPLLVINAAALSVGEKPLAALSDASPVAICMSSNYELRVGEAICAARWRFSMAAERLIRRDEAPLERFAATYAAPDEALIVHSVSVRDVEIPFERYGALIHCDAGVDDPVVADFGWRAPEAMWTPGFTAYVVELLAADIARGPMRKPELGAEIAAGAEVRRRLAASMEAQNRTPERLDVGTFLRARRGGRR